MAIIPIRTFPDPLLKQKSKRVRILDNSVRHLVGNMLETMHYAQGVGLAAPQIGVPLRVIVIGIPGEEEIVLINPKMVRRSGERLLNEGCLSIPGYAGMVKRSETVTVKGRNLNGKEIRVKADGLLAQVLEHETDHINGILYIDHLESLDKLRQIEAEEYQL